MSKAIIYTCICVANKLQIIKSMCGTLLLLVTLLGHSCIKANKKENI